MSKRTGIICTDGDFFDYMLSEERKILEGLYSPEEVDRILAEDDEEEEEEEAEE